MKDDIIKLEETSSLVPNNANPLNINNAKVPGSQAVPGLPFQGKANRRLKLKKPIPQPVKPRTAELVADKDSAKTCRKLIGLWSRIKLRVMLVFLMILLLLYFLSHIVLFLKCNISSHGIVLRRTK